MLGGLTIKFQTILSEKGTTKNAVNAALSDKPIVRIPATEKPADSSGSIRNEKEGIPAGIGHEATAESRKFFGLKEYTKVRVSDAELNAAADKLIKKRV